MIRKFEHKDLEQVMNIWFYSNLDAHSFIDRQYWLEHLADVREQLPLAEVYVAEEEGKIRGFIGIRNHHLEGLFVEKKHHGKGIGKSLLDHLKVQEKFFTLRAYCDNEPAIDFYLKQGFIMISTGVDRATGFQECLLKWERTGLKIRQYEEADSKETRELFYDTVHCINKKDYQKEQLDVWAKKEADLEKWNQSLLNNHSLVAIDEGKIIGFGDIDNSGYLDRLFVHKDYQRRGIATYLCNQLERYAKGKITVQASITAKPFFEKRGYRVRKAQEVYREGIALTNYVMEKDRRNLG